VSSKNDRCKLLAHKDKATDVRRRVDSFSLFAEAPQSDLFQGFAFFIRGAESIYIFWAGYRRRPAKNSKILV
jgi:hypothetical protein